MQKLLQSHSPVCLSGAFKFLVVNSTAITLGKSCFRIRGEIKERKMILSQELVHVSPCKVCIRQVNI